MGLVLLIGGVRSGKSRLAVEVASKWSRSPVVIATGEARDAEMTKRIARHRAERPEHWTTIEEPIDLEAALGSVPTDEAAIVDCLTLWVSNLMEREQRDDSIVEAARRAAEVAAARPGGVLAVSNEVGSGVIPNNPLGRRFGDVLGRVNTVWAAAADRVFLVVAGRALPLERPESLFDG